MGKRTSIVLSPVGNALRAKHCNVFGLQPMIEAGLWLFDQLPDDNARAEVIRKISRGLGGDAGVVASVPPTRPVSPDRVVPAAETLADESIDAGRKRAGRRRDRKVKSG